MLVRETPRPKHGPRSENERPTGRVAVFYEIMRRGARCVDASIIYIVVAVLLHGRRREVNQAGRHEAVIRRRIPLVAEKARRQGCCLSGSGIGHAGVAPETQLRVAISDSNCRAIRIW